MKNIVNKIPNNNTVQKNNRFEDRKPREKMYRGYTVEVPPGGDPLRAYRKIKRMLKENKVFEEMREREGYTKPSAKKRLARKMALLVKRRATRRFVEESTPWLVKRKK